MHLNFYNMQQKPTLSEETGLTPVQEQTAILLASGESISSVAEKLNLNRSTIYQWQEILTFQCFFNQQKQDIRESIRNEIFKIGKNAVKVLKDCMESNDEKLRLKASLEVIDRIESASIGEYNVRKILKEEATYKPLDIDLNAPVLDEEKYVELLEEYGLNPKMFQ